MYRFTLHKFWLLDFAVVINNVPTRPQSAVDYTGRESKEPRTVPADEKGVRFDILHLPSLLVCCSSHSEWGTPGLGCDKSPTPPRAVVSVRMGQCMCWLYPARLLKPTPTRLPCFKLITRITLLTCPQRTATALASLAPRAVDGTLSI